MYDFVQFRFDLPPGPGAERVLAAAPALAAAELVPATGGPGGPRLRASYRGLRLDYWPDLRRGRVRGSLHSFAYGHNAGPFPPAAVGLACRELAVAVGIPPELLLVQRLEAGLNRQHRPEVDPRAGPTGAQVAPGISAAKPAA